MKIWVSIIGGISIGAIISFFFLEYDGWTIQTVGEEGEVTKTINELDFNLISNGFLIMLVTAIVIYFTWTLIERMGRK
jgi:Na+/H+ antiporter NhaC